MNAVKTYYASSTCSPPPPPPSLSGYRKILINYATENFSQAQKINAKTGRLHGKFDEVICYGPQDIDAGFYEKNRNILTEKRGAGYWLWKPYVILKTLRRMKDGDYLFYADSGSFFIAPIDFLIRATAEMDHKIAICVHRKKLKNRVKRDALILTDMDKPAYLNEPIVQANAILLKKSDETVNLIKEWLKLCCDRRLVTDDENIMGKPDHPEFIEHRHDQSLFTLLCIKYGFMNCSYIRVDQNPVMETLAHNRDCFMPVIITRRKKTNGINVFLAILIVRIFGISDRIGGQKSGENDTHTRLARRRTIRKWILFSFRISERCRGFYESVL